MRRQVGRHHLGWALAVLIGIAMPGAAHALCDEGAAADQMSALQAQQIGQALPLAYVGTFQWDGDSREQPLTVYFYACELDGTVQLVGSGHYLHSDTRIDVIADVHGLSVVLVERNPQGGVGPFIVDGRHEGDIAPDLTRICAVWTTNDTGRTGRLRLGRTPEDAQGCFEPLNIS